MMQEKRPLPPTIQRVLQEARGLLVGYLRWKCLLLVICWILLVFWVGGALDYLPVKTGAAETPRTVRAGLLIVMAAGSGWIVLGWLLPRLLTRVNDSSLALLIEKHHPSIRNELVTAVELHQKPADVANPQAHEEMLQRVLISAEAAAKQVDVERLFNWRPIRQLKYIASLGILATLLTGLVSWNWLSTWSSRLFLLSSETWPRSAALKVDWLQLQLPMFTGQLVSGQKKIEFNDNLAYVPAGASLLLQVSADASAPRIPEVCTLYYRSDDGTRGRANLRRIGTPREGWQQFNLDGPPLDGITSSMNLDIAGLDARLRDLRLQLVDPVVISDMQMECVYPEYLLDSMSIRAARERLPYRTGLRIPEGTDCTLIGTCSSPLSNVDFVSRSPEGSSEIDSLEVSQAMVDQRQFRISLGRLRASQLLEIRLFDEYGLPSDQIMRYNLVVVPDAIPEVESRLEGIGLAITPRAFLPIRGKVTDDYGVDEVLVELSVDETVHAPIPLPLSDDQLSGEIDFLKLAESGSLQLKPGMTVGLSVTATDRYDLDDRPRVGRGQPVQLAVVSDDQLLVMLDRQELELRQRLEQILAELSQLNEALYGLRDHLSSLESSARILSPAKDFRQLSAIGRESHEPPSDFDSQSAGEWVAQRVYPVMPMLVHFQSPDQAAEEPDEDQIQQHRAERQASVRMSVLRAQQAQLQTDKSRQELAGIANRVEHLRLQLVNNRMDNLDRQQRLLEQVQQPLVRLLDGEYVRLDNAISELVSATMSGAGTVPVNVAIDTLARVLLELENIRVNLLDIESFNELIDLVRGLLDEQERILKETEETQKARILDFLN